MGGPFGTPVGGPDGTGVGSMGGTLGGGLGGTLGGFWEDHGEAMGAICGDDAGALGKGPWRGDLGGPKREPRATEGT